MEELLTKIGELIAVEIEEVESIEYTDKEMGYMFYINMADGKKFCFRLLIANYEKRCGCRIILGF